MESNENKEFEEILHAVISEIEQLLIKKNKDYGAKNLLTFGSLGILIRLSDKSNLAEKFCQVAFLILK